jgi:putative serine protease PepD
MKRSFSPIAALIGGIAAAAVVVLAGGGGAGGGTTTRTVVRSASASASASAATRPVAAPGGVLSAAQIYQQASPGVVAIQATGTGGGTDFFGNQQQQSDSGSGIVLSRDGLILTNNHVIDGASTITVQVGGSGGPEHSATVVGTDPNSDLALIRVNDASALNLHPLALADSSTVQVGDPAYAIGNPYGLDQTLTTGVVSALARRIQAPDGAAIAGVIQTDAALNPGNSGGPLLDATGRVIGVNSQIQTGSQGSSSSSEGSVGVGFAVSSNTARAVIAKLTGTARTGATN